MPHEHLFGNLFPWHLLQPLRMLCQVVQHARYLCPMMLRGMLAYAGVRGLSVCPDLRVQYHECLSSSTLSSRYKLHGLQRAVSTLHCLEGLWNTMTRIW
jgi:hypothetical protein